MRALTALLVAATLSVGFACEPAPHMEPEPRLRKERIEWRTQLGSHAAQTFVFEDCVSTDDLAAALERYGAAYGLSGRDVAESIVWGMYRDRSSLPPIEAPTLETYLDAVIDRYGERLLDVTSILFGPGSYDRTLNLLFYPLVRSHLFVADPAELKTKVGSGLSYARWFFDLETEYETMRASWP
jgi:hypothetical protein